MTRHVGDAQDKIGWQHFTEDKTARPIRNLQKIYMISCPTLLTINLWMRVLIKKLLNLTHSQ